MLLEHIKKQSISSLSTEAPTSAGRDCGKSKTRCRNKLLNPSKTVQMMEKPKNSKPMPWNKGQKQEPEVRAKPEAAHCGGGRSHPGAIPNSSPGVFEGISSSEKAMQEGQWITEPCKSWAASNTHPG